MPKPPAYHRGRRAYDEMNRRHGRVDPHDMSQERLLEILDISPQAAEGLVAYGNGSVFRLIGTETEDLEGVPGVGKATLARLTALIEFINRWESERTTILAELDAREGRSPHDPGQGDVA